MSCEKSGVLPFEQRLKEKAAQIEEILRAYLPERSGYQQKIMEAMEYSLLAGGKLMQEVYHLFGGKGKQIEPFMAAMEMIHTYSLVHDDLPAMDDDEYRRGRKTTHIVYGEAMAVLAGDALLNYAFETACRAFDMEEGSPAQIGTALKILAGKAGIFGMVGGQVVDVESEGQQIGGEKLEYIYRLKTGALIESSMMIGAVLAGASKEQVWPFRSRMIFWMWKEAVRNLASLYTVMRGTGSTPMSHGGDWKKRKKRWKGSPVKRWKN